MTVSSQTKKLLLRTLLSPASGRLGLANKLLACTFLYSGTSLRRTPLGPTKLSIIERVSSGQGFIIHYVGYIWDSVSVHYREGVLWRGVSANRGSIVYTIATITRITKAVTKILLLKISRFTVCHSPSLSTIVMSTF